jgi:predicted transcriptional regulator
MNRIRVKKNKNFTTINNEFIFNKSLSLKAKGLMCHLLALPDSWKLFVCEVIKWHKDGQRAVYSAMNELIENGYMKREQIREAGKIKGYNYTVFEKPYVQNVNEENVNEENAQLLNTNNTKDLIKLNNNNYIEQLEQLEINVEAWLYWKEYRKEQFRLVYKPMGEKAALKKLLRLSNNNKELQLKIIEQSVENSWKGLFELKEIKKSKVQNSFDAWQEARNIINNG